MGMDLPAHHCHCLFRLPYICRRQTTGVSHPKLILWQRQQAGITAHCGGIHAKCSFRREAMQVIWTARFRSGSRQSLATERLSPHDRTDHIAVNIKITYPGTRLDP